MKIIAFIILALSLLSGCSAKAIYNAGKINREHHCREHVGPEREQCLQEINQKSYEQYEKEREQVLKGETERQLGSN